MKKTLDHVRLIFFFSLGLLSVQGNAQTASQYIFTTSYEPFIYLTGGNTPSFTGYVFGPMPIGFSFNYCGVNYTDVRASVKGWLTFNSTSTIAGFGDNGDFTAMAAVKPALFPFWDQIGPTSTSTYLYSTIGNAPNRVFTIEWREMQWFSGTTSPAISFQVKLYETTNKIKFIYNRESNLPSSIPSAMGASIGIVGDTAIDYLALNSASSLPTVSTTSFVTSILDLPMAGQVYSFSAPDTPASCSGSPAAGNVIAVGPWAGCLGQTITLIDTGYAVSGNINFQWQTSTNNGGTWTNIPGATNYACQVTPFIETDYRIKVICTASSQFTFSPSIQLTGSLPVYSAIPYFQDFENWTNGCAMLDIPGLGWINNPSSGNSSWRRENQGNSGNWIDPNMGFGTLSGIGGPHYARFHSVSVSSGMQANLDLLIDCSGQTGNKGLYFYYLNRKPSQLWQATQDSLLIYISTNAGITFSRIATLDTGNWDKIYIPISSNSANTIIRFQGINEDQNQANLGDIGIDSVSVMPPCNSLPAAGYITSTSPTFGCPGNSFFLESNGASMAGDLTYQWQFSIDGGGNWLTINGANGLICSIQGLYDTTQFRLSVTCNSTGQTIFSNSITINVQTPLDAFANLPYLESFENWTNQCDSNDVPGTNGISHWANAPAHNGSNSSQYGSWRREDQGASAGWIAPTENMYYPASVNGTHSARFYTNSTYFGNLDLLVDCSTNGIKQLQFFLNLAAVGISSSTEDSLGVYLSENGGMSFSRIGSYSYTNGWELKSIFFSSNSSTAVIRFSSELLSHAARSIGLDLVKVLVPCSGQPTAGTVDSVSPCPGKAFFLQLSGATESNGLSYQWQQSTNGSLWANIPGDTNSFSQQIINVNTWYRCIVKCNATGLADTTTSRYIHLAPFYYCYCDAYPLLYTAAHGNIGNTTIKDSLMSVVVMDNGNSNPLQNNPNLVLYSNYQFLTPNPIFYRDTTYFIKFTEILDQNYVNQGRVTAFIDYNRDGNYDPAYERAFTGYFNSGNQIDSGYFHVPPSAQTGLTGMRFILNTIYNSDPNSPPQTPCAYDNFQGGEVEDYVVKIDFSPCNGLLNAGVTAISDTLVTNGSIVIITNTSHASPDSLMTSQLSWIWQFSADNINWTDILGSGMQDSLHQAIFSKSWYRLKMICQHSHDTSYSNVVFVNIDNSSVSTISAVRTIRLYPNPTDGNLTLNYLGTPQHRLEITLTDITGKQLFQKSYNDIESDFVTPLNLNGLAKGVYLIRIDFDHGYSNHKVILK